jgi:hypothetical protein
VPSCWNKAFIKMMLGLVPPVEVVPGQLCQDESATPQVGSNTKVFVVKKDLWGPPPPGLYLDWFLMDRVPGCPAGLDG